MSYVTINHLHPPVAKSQSLHKRRFLFSRQSMSGFHGNMLPLHKKTDIDET